MMKRARCGRVVLESFLLFCLICWLGQGGCAAMFSAPVPRRHVFSTAAGLSLASTFNADAGFRARAITAGGNEYDAIAGVEVAGVSGEVRKLGDLVDAQGQTVLALLTHFGDFNAWEYAQQLKYDLPVLEGAGASLVVVGIGNATQARRFAELLDLPSGMRLYADTQGAAAVALGCSRGFGGGVPVTGYIKLLPMLLGIGSPGTLEAVLRGYRGDASARRDWVDAALAQGSAQRRFPEGLGEKDWDYLGGQGLRPLELATLRLQNMVDGIIAHWSELSPTDDQLLVQQGGTAVFRARSPKYVYRDAGILTFTPIDEVIRAVTAA